MTGTKGEKKMEEKTRTTNKNLTVKDEVIFDNNNNNNYSNRRMSNRLMQNINP